MVLLVSGLISKLNHASISYRHYLRVCFVCRHLSLLNCLSDLSVDISSFYSYDSEKRGSIVLSLLISCVVQYVHKLSVRCVERGSWLRSAWLLRRGGRVSEGECQRRNLRPDDPHPRRPLRRRALCRIFLYLHCTFTASMKTLIKYFP